MALTDTTIRNAKARDKDYKLADSGGLYLLITPASGKLWRLKFRIDGKERKLALGRYPDISLADARKQRDAARSQMAQGADPAREKQRRKVHARLSAENTFAAIAAEYCAKRKRDGEKRWAASTAIRCEFLLERLGASIGHLPIAEIEPADVLAAMRKIESWGKLESARRTLQLAGSVFRYAVATARLASDPTRDLKGALTAPTVTHYGAITDAAKVGQLLRSIDDYDGSGITRLALQLAPQSLSAPVNFAMQNGARSIWTARCGRSRRAR